MISEAVSKNSKRIRLTERQWAHIAGAHNYLAGLEDAVLDAVRDPDFVIAGRHGEFLALKRRDGKYTICVYREAEQDGFVITAYLTRNIERLKQWGSIWTR